MLLGLMKKVFPYRAPITNSAAPSEFKSPAEVSAVPALSSKFTPPKTAPATGPVGSASNPVQMTVGNDETRTRAGAVS